MDTTHMEYTAEDLISYKLQRSGLLVAKPKFDRNGADLLAFMNVDEGTKFCRIQCKGRSLLNSNSSNVEVLKSYVTDAFILLLFINDGNEQSTNLFCFFSNDIKNKWKLKAFKNRSKDFYRLSFSKTTINNVNKRGNLQEYYLTDQKIENIKNIIKHSDTKKEFKIVFDLMKNQNDLIKWINRSKLCHSFRCNCATHSGVIVPLIPIDVVPLIPEQSVPPKPELLCHKTKM